MSLNPDISIITLTKNDELGFQISAKSIYDQKFKGVIEWLIIDGSKKTIFKKNFIYITNLYEKDNSNSEKIKISHIDMNEIGVNGIYALAMGKVVLGGAEPEDLKFLGVKKTPVINVLPDHNHIVKVVEELLSKRDEIQRIGYESRIFAEKVYGHINVAKKYLSVWNKN